MIRALVLGLLVACNGDAPAAKIAPAPPTKPAAAIDLAAARDLPGALWVHDDAGPSLVRIENGTADARSAVVDGETIYLSGEQIADGRIVAIASHGDGRPNGEHLALFAPSGSVTPVGPTAAQVRSPTLAKGGAWIVAAYTDSGVSNLRQIHVASQKVTPVTNDPQGNFTPAAIGADAVTFVSSRDGDSEVYVQNVVTNAVTRITAFHREDYDPSPDPVGQHLAFVSDREQGVARIFLVSPAGTQLRRLTTRDDPAVEEGAPRWFDETLLAYTITEKGRASLVLRSLGAPTEIERIVTPSDASDQEPAFSPDGRYVAVIRERAGQPSELVVIATDRETPERIVARGAVHLPRWF